ncbi:c-type cytochrome [Salegentibacter chungangensis]|uniref:C-type cytochrome n=1 Tax=Salegentibacter chungangensis TaxID=1335724 RepID=A0ABW3NTQ6_9FLAO
MKSVIKSSYLIFLLLLATGCGNSEKKEKEEMKLGDYSSIETKKEVKKENKSETKDLSNKGIGPVQSLDVPESIDQEMAAHGQNVFKNMCSACHKMDKKFIGPALSGVSERRSPEWIMNMILNPEEMIAKDPIAKQLVIESNMAVMANQNLSEADARAVLEYFRSNDN